MSERTLDLIAEAAADYTEEPCPLLYGRETLEEIGLDSLGVIMAITHIAKRLEFDLSAIVADAEQISTLRNMKHVNELVEYVSAHFRT